MRAVSITSSVRRTDRTQDRAVQNASTPVMRDVIPLTHPERFFFAESGAWFERGAAGRADFARGLAGDPNAIARPRRRQTEMRQMIRKSCPAAPGYARYKRSTIADSARSDSRVG
jgi:hypothetical protein